MSRLQVTYRRPLQDQQLDILKWLHTYRFSTCDQITTYLEKLSYAGAQKRLRILEAQGFIGKRYDKSHKFTGRAAEYYLTPAGAQQLQLWTDYIENIDDRTFRALYRNKKVSNNFAIHCINIVNVVLKLKVIHGNKCSISTKVDMVAHDYFPNWTPDLFLSIKTQQFLLDVWDDTMPSFIAKRKTRNYLKYVEEEMWPTETSPAPAILYVCQDMKGLKKLQRYIQGALDDTYDDKTISRLRHNNS